MDNKDRMEEIITLCLEIDIMAREVYKKFSSLPVSSPFQALFKKLQADEEFHIKYWEALLKLSREGEKFELFEDTEKLLFELGAAAKDARAVMQETMKMETSDISSLLLAVIKMENILMHPSFVVLFQSAGTIPDQLSMDEEYAEHIEHICGALNTYAAENQMFKLFSELMRRVWQETKRLVSVNQEDVLSGVLNRRGFHEQIRPLCFLALRKSFSIAVMILDIDRFKQINDSYGHQAGDRVLRLVAQSIKENVRQSDVVARYGGDEFIVFFSDTQEEALISMAEKIKTGIAGQSGNFVPATVSIGIAFEVIRDEPKIAVERLIREADKALFEAKEGGRDSFRVHSLL
jgi:diguanylate cyclase (GGDEF)-like protein